MRQKKNIYRQKILAKGGKNDRTRATKVSKMAQAEVWK